MVVWVPPGARETVNQIVKTLMPAAEQLQVYREGTGRPWSSAVHRRLDYPGGCWRPWPTAAAGPGC